jgi:hypothetical protein
VAEDVEHSAEQRRAARAHWPITRHRLTDEPSDDVSAVTTPAERIAMMWTLAEAAWKLAGLPWPTYERGSVPTRFYRAGAPRPPDDDA